MKQAASRMFPLNFISSTRRFISHLFTSILWQANFFSCYVSSCWDQLTFLTFKYCANLFSFVSKVSSFRWLYTAITKSWTAGEHKENDSSEHTVSLFLSLSILILSFCFSFFHKFCWFLSLLPLLFSHVSLSLIFYVFPLFYCSLFLSLFHTLCDSHSLLLLYISLSLPSVFIGIETFGISEVSK